MDLYDANTNTWKRVDDLTEPRAFLVGAAAGSLIVFAGGYKCVCIDPHLQLSCDSSTSYFATVDIYNSTGFRFTGSPLSTPRSDLMAAVISGFILFAGGTCVNATSRLLSG